MNAKQSKQTGGRIIVAEDDTELRHLIASALRKDGHEVVEAASGAQLMNVVVQHAIYADPTEKPADVIISDVYMPGCSGLQVLADMRGREWAPPVVLMTAFSDSYVRHEAGRLGASAVFDKPLDLASLRSLISSLVSAQKQPVMPVRCEEAATPPAW